MISPIFVIFVIRVIGVIIVISVIGVIFVISVIFVIRVISVIGVIVLLEFTLRFVVLLLLLASSLSIRLTFTDVIIQFLILGLISDFWSDF